MENTQRIKLLRPPFKRRAFPHIPTHDRFSFETSNFMEYIFHPSREVVRVDVSVGVFVSRGVDSFGVDRQTSDHNIERPRRHSGSHQV